MKTHKYFQKHEVLCGLPAISLEFLNLFMLTIISMRAVLGFRKPAALFCFYRTSDIVCALFTQGVALRIQCQWGLKLKRQCGNESSPLLP
jgi:hypothetical protein